MAEAKTYYQIGCEAVRAELQRQISLWTLADEIISRISAFSLTNPEVERELTILLRKLQTTLKKGSSGSFDLETKLIEPLKKLECTARMGADIT